jgi:hypothetical protein
MLKLRSIGLSDYALLESEQRIGQIRLATERMQDSYQLADLHRVTVACR